MNTNATSVEEHATAAHTLAMTLSEAPLPPQTKPLLEAISPTVRVLLWTDKKDAPVSARTFAASLVPLTQLADMLTASELEPVLVLLQHRWRQMSPLALLRIAHYLAENRRGISRPLARRAASHVADWSIAQRPTDNFLVESTFDELIDQALAWQQDDALTIWRRGTVEWPHACADVRVSGFRLIPLDHGMQLLQALDGEQEILCRVTRMERMAAGLEAWWAVESPSEAARHRGWIGITRRQPNAEWALCREPAPPAALAKVAALACKQANALTLQAKTDALIRRASAGTFLTSVPAVLERLLNPTQERYSQALPEILGAGFRVIVDANVLIDPKLARHLDAIDDHIRDGACLPMQIVVPSSAFAEFCRIRSQANRHGRHSPAHSATLRRIENWQCRGVLEMPEIGRSSITDVDAPIIDLCRRLSAEGDVALLTNDRSLRIQARESVPNLVVLGEPAPSDSNANGRRRK